MLNDIKVGVKLIGSIVTVCLIAAAVILYGIKVRNDVVHKVDSVHRQYEINIRDIGNVRVSLEKWEETFIDTLVHRRIGRR